MSPTIKLLSQEEMQALLARTRDAVSPNVTTVKALDKEESRLEGGPSDITPVEKFERREDSPGSDSELDIVPACGSSPSANPPEDPKATSDQTQVGYHNGSSVDDDPHGSAEPEGECPANEDPTLAHPELAYMYEDEEVQYTYLKPCLLQF